MDWKQEAERLKFDESRSWTQVTDEIAHYFPELNKQQVFEKVRGVLRNSPRYKKDTTEEYKSSIEYRQDGSIISDRIIEICEADAKTPESILKAHKFDPDKWIILACRNNYWHSQVKGGTRLVMYQSRLTVKPKEQAISLVDIDKHFSRLDRKYKSPIITPIVKNGHMMAEVNIADLHLGKLCWRGDTGNNFDYKIAREVFYKIINEICNDLQAKPLEYITFVWANDFFNSDNAEKTTTAGTPQDTDVRWQKLFNIGCDMLVTGVDILAQIAPVKTFYTPSNHDTETGYHAIKFMEAWFRKDDRIEIDTDARGRKYRLYGNTLIGYTHGDKETPQNGSKEKASKLASVMPLEAKELWSQARYYEMHTAHLHSEHAIEEINGVIVRRISSPTATDTWHYEKGYVGAVRKAQTFIYDKERGLIQVINTPVI